MTDLYNSLAPARWPCRHSSVACSLTWSRKCQRGDCGSPLFHSARRCPAPFYYTRTSNTGWESGWNYTIECRVEVEKAAEKSRLGERTTLGRWPQG
jgi:hypothetical protein